MPEKKKENDYIDSTNGIILYIFPSRQSEFSLVLDLFLWRGLSHILQKPSPVLHSSDLPV